MGDIVDYAADREVLIQAYLARRNRRPMPPLAMIEPVRAAIISNVYTNGPARTLRSHLGIDGIHFAMGLMTDMVAYDKLCAPPIEFQHFSRGSNLIWNAMVEGSSCTNLAAHFEHAVHPRAHVILGYVAKWGLPRDIVRALRPYLWPSFARAEVTFGEYMENSESSTIRAQIWPYIYECTVTLGPRSNLYSQITLFVTRVVYALLANGFAPILRVGTVVNVATWKKIIEDVTIARHLFADTFGGVMTRRRSILDLGRCM